MAHASKIVAVCNVFIFVDCVLLLHDCDFHDLYHFPYLAYSCKLLSCSIAVSECENLS